MSHLRAREPALPRGTVRGDIAHYLHQHADKLASTVLEIGSLLPDNSPWANNRHLAPDAEWIGIDMQPGANVDQVENAEALPAVWSGRFGAVLCSEVLEHSRHPWIVLSEAARVLRPGGWIVVTVPFCFYVHNYPGDYWRLTPQCLRELLSDAGFADVDVEECGPMPLLLNNTGAAVATKHAPRHVFAVGRKT